MANDQQGVSFNTLDPQLFNKWRKSDSVKAEWDNSLKGDMIQK